MEHTPLPFIWRKRRLILIWIVSLVVLCTALLGLARLWIKSDSGRAFVLSHVNGRDVSGYGVIDISGLEGDPLSRMTARRVTITDRDGVWLSAEDIDITWTPWALTRNTVYLNTVEAGRLTLERRPVRDTTQEKPPSKPSTLTAKLDSLKIPNVVIQEPVAGTRADFEVEAKLVTHADNRFDIGLTVSPQNTTTDKLSLKLVRNIVGDIHLNAQGYAEPNGVFANFLRLTPNQSAQIDANITGTRVAGDGFARILIDEYKAADLTTSWAGNDLATTLLLDAAKLPVPERVASLIGPSARINLSATLDESAAPIQLTADLANGKLAASSRINPKTRTLTEPLQIKAQLLNAEPLIGRSVAVELDGALAADRLKAFKGTGKVTSLAQSDLMFKTLSGPIEFDLSEQTIPFTADLKVTGFHTQSDQMMRLLSARPAIAARGIYDRSTGDLTLERAALVFPDGRISVAGKYGTQTRTSGLKGQLSLPVKPLLEAATGKVSGDVSLKGPVEALLIGIKLEGKNLDGLQPQLQSLIGATARLDGRAVLKGNTLHIETADLTAEGISANVNGTYRPDGPLALNLTARQQAPLALGSTEILAGTVTAKLSGDKGERNIIFSTESGQLKLSGQAVDELAMAGTLEQTASGLSGRVDMTGETNDQHTQLGSSLLYQEGRLTLPDIRGVFSDLTLSGAMTRSESGDIESDLTLSGENVRLNGTQVDTLDLTARILQAGDKKLAVTADGTVNGISLANGFIVEGFGGSAKLNDRDLSFDLTAKQGTGITAIDIKASGDMSLASHRPQGSVSLDGKAFGQPITTHTPIKWSLDGDGAFAGDVSVLGGRLTVESANTNVTQGFNFNAADIDLAPLALHFGVPLNRAKLKGAGQFNLFGPAPGGEFAFTTSGAIDGIDTPLLADITGRLTDRSLTIKSTATANELSLKLDAALPVEAGEDKRPVKLVAGGAIQSRATLKGDLSALRSIALAFGHDVGGMIDARATVTGTLDTPALSAAGTLTNGTYELGRTGMRLKDIKGATTYEDGRLELNLDGRDSNGGQFTVTGTSKGEAIEIATQLKSLKLYDRDEDDLTASGTLAFRQTGSARDLVGDIKLDSGHFDITHLPTSHAKAIDVRWDDTGATQAAAQGPTRPVRLKVNLDAPRHLYVTGRGLTSEWALDLAITGDTTTPLLTGTASLARGSLDFAGRPFEFDNGAIEFNGPLSASTIALAAERSVNGFNARIALSGTPQAPALELTSTPSLPEDEILSRLLFGRASVDLSALEVAQLAASVSKVMGQDNSLDPTESLKHVLGVDRFSLGSTDSGQTQVGVGQSLSNNVYLEVSSTATEGTTIGVEWEPRPKMSITSETTTTGESNVSVKWKSDY